MNKTRSRKVMLLPVKLTPDELRTKGADLAKCYGEREIEELTKKIQATASKSKIDEINARAKVIVEALRTGKEDREIECIEEIDFTKRVANTYRTDTDPWEIIASRGLTRDELQLTFKGDPAEVPASAKAEELVDQVDTAKEGEAVGAEAGEVAGTVTAVATAEVLVGQVVASSDAPTGDIVAEGVTDDQATFDDPGFGTVDPNGASPDPGDVPLRVTPEADPLPDTPSTQPGAAGMVVDLKRPKRKAIQ